MVSTELEPVKNSPLTEKLLANARKSLSDVAEITGLSVQDVSERYAILFEERGWMTERQEERLLLIELGDLLADSRAVLKDAPIEQYASIARTVLANIKLIADRLDARRKVVDADIQQITRGQAHVFGEAFDLTLNHVVDGLMILHPDIERSEINDLVDEGMKMAKRKLEESIVG